MADHVDESAGTSEGKSLDQRAIDDAIAAMQMDGSETGEAAGEGLSETETARGSAGSEGTAAISEPPAHLNGGDTFAEAESDGNEDLDAAIAAIQEDVFEEGEKEMAVKAGASDSDPADVTEDEKHPMDELSELENSPNETAPGDKTVPEVDAQNTFSDLGTGDLADPGPDRATIEAGELAAMTASFEDEQDFSGLDDEEPEQAAAISAEEPTKMGSAQTGCTEGFADRKRVFQGAGAQKQSEPKATAGSLERSGGKKKYVGILVIVATIIIGLTVIYGRDFYSFDFDKPAETAPEATAAERSPNVPAPVMPAAEVTPEDLYREKLQEVARLRADLLAKKDEIDQLKQFYRDGISELEEELQQEAARQNVQKLSDALGNPKIVLDLRSIQRRWAYIDELEKPSHWLYQGSEELFFLSRRAQIDLQMSSIAAGIEMTRHTRHLNASLQKYQLSPERLAIDPHSSRLRPLEDIWRSIGAENKAIARHAIANGDRIIIAEICDGNTQRIAELTTLTIKAAKCLSQIDSSELFLNQLSSISPVAAKYLSNWKGQWLCLNGFRELSPEVARHLFAWDGNWISLNGLEAFPAQIGEMLISWQGRQLELMGLVYNPDQIERIGLQQLADWEKSGGKLFVPERIRTEINRLN